MRPTRPEMSNAVPPPIVRERTPPPLLRAAGGSWLLGGVAGVVSLVFAFLGREEQLGDLRETAGSLDSRVDAARVDEVVSIALWGTMGFFALVLLVEALLVRSLLRGRGWARWALLGMVIVDGGAVLLVLAFLGDDSPGFQPVAHLAVAQLLLAVVALVLSLLPPAARWFREQRPVR